MKDKHIDQYMNEKKIYLNIHMEGERTEIGVLGIENAFENRDEGTEVIKTKMKLDAEERLVNALTGHFTCETKIVSSEITRNSPLEIKVHVLLCEEEEDRYADVVLKETWLY
jgi:hypothetical protein